MYSATNVTKFGFIQSICIKLGFIQSICIKFLVLFHCAFLLVGLLTPDIIIYDMGQENPHLLYVGGGGDFFDLILDFLDFGHVAGGISLT